MIYEPKKLKFFEGLPPSVFFENIEIFWKLALKNSHKLWSQNRLILEKWGCLQEIRVQNVKNWLSYEHFFATWFFSQISDENFKVPQFPQFWTSDSLLLHETYNYIKVYLGFKKIGQKQPLGGFPGGWWDPPLSHLQSEYAVGNRVKF